MHEVDTAAEVHLEPFRTYTIEIFSENSYTFCLLSFIIENWHGSKYASQPHEF